MADRKQRLTKGSITLAELIAISYDYYQKNDDKILRAKLDIKSARLTRRQNYSYNKSKKEWQQTGRDVKFTFLVKSEPISYKKTDSLKFHYYPVTILVHDVSKGVNSPIKVRCGSLYKPRSIRKGLKTEQRKRLVEQDIKNGVELNFFFYDEWILKQFDLLYGINWAGWPPRKTNPDMWPYLCKHLWFISSKILVPLLGKEGLKLREVWKND